MRIAVGLLTFALVACCPSRAVIKEPVVIETERLVVERVDDALTEPNPIATGPLAACPQVARQRKSEIERCNADKASIRKRHGAQE